MVTILFLLLTVCAAAPRPAAIREPTYLVPQPGEIAESVRNLMERTYLRAQQF